MATILSVFGTKLDGKVSDGSSDGVAFDGSSDGTVLDAQSVNVAVVLCIKANSEAIEVVLLLFITDCRSNCGKLFLRGSSDKLWC